MMFLLKAANLLLLSMPMYAESSDFKNPDGGTLNRFQLLRMMVH